eukprot:CAMPEP_0194132418 /NCGR_PEP_ID=MMETSP0152-20130528/2899_1 /TAXON_ID=1049557 /ORGANISM="Thalassiothrix antarctica, Strain L6-D1" /LENGTH=154 /DNA_ID=CAMNT_0038827475 /DNA_START=84 /DNA_END=548 /DNA_ORIENTATION=+
MAPPQHVQIISGTASAMLFLIGLRGLIAPGAKIPFFPKAEHDLQAYFWGTKDPKLLVNGQKALSKIQGMQIMTLAAAKLTVLFSHVSEGTFLRRNLFVALGSGQFLGSLVMLLTMQKKAKSEGATFLPFVLGLGVEGAVLLYDALMRERKTKAN